MDNENEKSERSDVVDSVPDEMLSPTNQEVKEGRRDCFDRVPDAALSSVVPDEKVDEGDCVDGIPDMTLPAENHDEKEKKCDVVDGVPFLSPNDSHTAIAEQRSSYDTEHRTHANVMKDSYQNNAVDSLVPSYKMDHPDRGYFVIFNQQEFAVKTVTLGKRDGTIIDALNLVGMAEFLGFRHDKIKVHTDFTRNEIMKYIRNYANINHRDHDCFVCVVLTHGQRLTTENSYSSTSKPLTFSKEILYAKDAAFELTDLKKPFEGDKCASLAGKPKLFFVQACRGSKFDDGAMVLESNHEEQENQLIVASDSPDGIGVPKKRIPAEADFLFGHCTVPEYFAWRNSGSGSCYMRHLCDCFRKHGHTHDVEQIMKLVSYNVANDFESDTGEKESSKKKQMPAFTSQLTKRLCFTKVSRTVVE